MTPEEISLEHVCRRKTRKAGDNPACGVCACVRVRVRACVNVCACVCARVNVVAIFIQFRSMLLCAIKVLNVQIMWYRIQVYGRQGQLKRTPTVVSPFHTHTHTHTHTHFIYLFELITLLLSSITTTSDIFRFLKINWFTDEY